MIPSVGEIVKVVETQSLTFIPNTPVGERGDTGIINFISDESFKMLCSDGTVKTYSSKSIIRPQSIKALIDQLKSVLGKSYSVLLSRGDLITMGSDPEIFVTTPDGTVIPAWEYLPRQADHQPKARHSNFADAAAFYDGVQAEFTTVPTCCLSYHIDSIRTGIKKVLDAARVKFPDCKLSIAPVVTVPESILATADETYVMLGCAPSENVYPDVEPIYVENPRKLELRFAGCHIHLGQKIPLSQLAPVVKSLDAIVGVAITATLDGLDDARRRQYYGRAGEIRQPPHGIEYRTLPSTTLVHPAVTHLAFDLARQTLWAAERGYTSLWECSEAEAREAIDSSNYKLARRIVRRNLSYLRSILMAIYSQSSDDPARPTTMAIRLMLEGARNLVPIDPELNWRLKGEWINHSESENASMINLSRTIAGSQK